MEKPRHDKAQARHVHKTSEVLRCSPRVHEGGSEGDRRKERQQQAGRIFVNSQSGGSECEYAADR